jgi:hypothetical protein
MVLRSSEQVDGGGFGVWGRSPGIKQILFLYLFKQCCCSYEVRGKTTWICQFASPKGLYVLLARLAVRKKHLWSSLPAIHAGQTASGLSRLIPQWGFPARKMLTTISHGSNTPLRASQRDGTVPSIVLDGGLDWVAHNRYSTSKRVQRALSLTV